MTNDTSENQPPLSEVVPPAIESTPTPATVFSPQSVKPARQQRWSAWLATLRYGRKPSLPKMSPSSLRSAAVWAKKYWWAVGAVIVVVAIAAAWKFHTHQQTVNWQQATDYYRRADYKKAAPLLLNMSLPTDPEQLRIYGQTMQATNHTNEAIKAYQALYDQKKDPFAKLVLGNIYNQQKKYDKAAKAYKDLIDANPTYIQAYVNLATVYRLQQQNSKAIDTANQALQNNPNDVTLAELAVSLTADDPNSEAYHQAIERLKKINPEDPLLQ